MICRTLDAIVFNLKVYIWSYKVLVQNDSYHWREFKVIIYCETIYKSTNPTHGISKH